MVRVEQSQQAPSVPLHSHRALRALLHLLRDSSLVHLAVSGPFFTWQELAAASPTERHRHLGSWAAHLRLPTVCPSHFRPATSRLVSRYEARYPEQLLSSVNPPVLLDIRGPSLSQQPRVVIGAGQYPSSRALHLARLAVEAVDGTGLGLLIVLGNPASRAALVHALAKNMTVCVVSEQPPSKLLETEPLAREVLARGGTLLADVATSASYEIHPHQRGVDQARTRAWQLACELACGVIVCESGLHLTGGAEIIDTALRRSLPLAVAHDPTPHAVRVEHIGSQVLLEPQALERFPTTVAPLLYSAPRELSRWLQELRPSI